MDHAPRPKHGPTRIFCDHIARPRPLTIPFIIFMITAAAPATGSLTPQTANRNPQAATKRGSGTRLNHNDHCDVVTPPEGGVTYVDLGRELPNFLSREINLWNEKEEGRRCTLTLGLRSFARHCLCAAHDQMFCSLLLEKGTRVTDPSGLPTPFLYLCTSLQVSLRTTHT